MVERTATVKNANGIHCRPSAEIVKHLKPYTGAVTVDSKNGQADLRSVLGLVSLGLEESFEVTIKVDGPDEATVCDDLVGLFERVYDFPPKGG